MYLNLNIILILKNSNEIIVGMYKGEIINMSLNEEDLYKFKNSQDYQEMTKLYKEKLYPDYQKYLNGDSF